ncbi:MAG: class I SAM-dependent methyltransferase [Candidatus Aminicenantes bacterium]|nr:class I SAM-dependent methyltransferase [Candidatus Aminicenantes bacterium]
MKGYYSDNLAAERLQKCYDLAPPRVRQYLDAEVDFLLGHVGPGDVVLDLGCGYGRIMRALAGKAGLVVGIDTSFASLALGRERLQEVSNCRLLQMNAVSLGFREKSFDVVACIQNGISAFGVDQRILIRESVRVAGSGGTVLFSTYAERFWPERLAWFEGQAEAGLLGEIDYGKTGDGVIVCKDGFRARTVSPGQFEELTSGLNARTEIVEVDESSLFCIMRIP